MGDVDDKTVAAEVVEYVVDIEKSDVAPSESIGNENIYTPDPNVEKREVPP